MGDRKRRRDAFFTEHPKCCFCGGETPATTEDHQPGRVFFKDRRWPEGFVFPACDGCNSRSREAEELVAILIHGEAETDDRNKYQTLMESVNRRYPNLVRSMLPESTREIREILKEGGVQRPVGTPYRDVPVIKLDSKFWEPHLTTFSRKLLLALHYQCFGTALPPSGAVWHFVHSNFDYMSGRFPEQLLDLAKNIATPARQKAPMGDQFGVRWNVVPGMKTGLFVCQFHDRLAVSGITTETPERFENAWKQTPLRPYDQVKVATV